MTDQIEAGTQDTKAGRGRLAQVIATRGGRAAPEAPFVIEHREALIYMLCEAAAGRDHLGQPAAACLGVRCACFYLVSHGILLGITVAGRAKSGR